MPLKFPGDNQEEGGINSASPGMLGTLEIPTDSPSATQRPLHWDKSLSTEITGRLGVNVNDLIVGNTLEVQTHTSGFTCVIENEGLRVRGGTLDGALFSKFSRGFLITSEKSEKQTYTGYVLSIRKV